MPQAQVLISSKYQVVIPKAVRRQVGIKSGQKLNVNLNGNNIVLSPAGQPNWPTDHLRLLKNPWQGTDPQAYLEKERNSWD